MGVTKNRTWLRHKDTEHAFNYIQPTSTTAPENTDYYTIPYLNWKNSVHQPGLYSSGIPLLPKDLSKPSLHLLHLPIDPNASLNVGSLKPGASHIFSPSVSNVLRQLTFVWWRACNSCLGIVFSCQHGLFHLFSGYRKMELSRTAHAMTTRDDPNTGSRNLARGMYCWWQNRNKAPEARLRT